MECTKDTFHQLGNYECHITAKYNSYDISIEHGQRVATWARDVGAFFYFNSDTTRPRIAETYVFLNTYLYLCVVKIVLISHRYQISSDSPLYGYGKKHSPREGYRTYGGNRMRRSRRASAVSFFCDEFRTEISAFNQLGHHHNAENQPELSF